MDNPEELERMLKSPDFKFQDLKDAIEKFYSNKNNNSNTILIIGSTTGGNNGDSYLSSILGAYSSGVNIVKDQNFDYNTAWESEKLRYKQIHGVEVSDTLLDTIKIIASGVNYTLLEVLERINNLEPHTPLSRGDYMRNEDLDAPALGSFKEEVLFSSRQEKKVQHFENKFIGKKVGGSKQKKNPFKRW